MLPVLWVVLSQLDIAFKLDNQLTQIADVFSEADTVRAGELYADQGFLKNAGLPDILYGARFAKEGSLGVFPELKTLIYTHYPPGPYWLCGAATVIFGKGQISKFRLIPIAAFAIGVGVFGWSLFLIFGMAGTFLVTLLLSLVPVFSNMMHGLHHQSYALAWLLLQWGLLLRVIYLDHPLTRGSMGGLFLVGFLQGWNSLDYFFLLSLSGLVIHFIKPPSTLSKAISKNEWIAILLPIFGFLLAFAIHVFQNSLYFGSAKAAIEDFLSAAHARLYGDSGDFNYRDAELLGFFSIIKYYAANFFTDPRYLGSLGTGLLLLMSAVIVTGPATYGLASVLALATSFLWIVWMRGHSLIHTHFIPRHFFFVYLVVTLCFVVRVRELGSKNLNKMVTRLKLLA